MTTYQFTPFEVGQVKAHMEHGLGCTTIMTKVKKPNGKDFYSETAIRNCMSKLEQDPTWRGEREDGSGAPRKTNEKQDKQIEKWVYDKRGEEKVSARSLKKEFPFLRKLSDKLVYSRLDDANLKYLRRRRKSLVEKKYLQPRVDYCHGVKRKHEETLEKWAYTDGTVWYLDRTEEEAENSKRRSLGPMVWRRSDNKDAMNQDCLGPSSYSKAQGTPVKVWGMLACGVVHIHILELGDTMNNMLYAELVEDKFEDWCGNCEWLVCDYEGCIRSADALHALSKTPLRLLDPYPVSAQDFNAMENVWDILRERLNLNQPRHKETREEFIKRLRAAVRWANEHRADQLWYLSTNQKERADECLNTKPPGGRTSW